MTSTTRLTAMGEYKNVLSPVPLQVRGVKFASPCGDTPGIWHIVLIWGHGLVDHEAIVDLIHESVPDVWLAFHKEQPIDVRHDSVAYLDQFHVEGNLFERIRSGVGVGRTHDLSILFEEQLELESISGYHSRCRDHGRHRHEILLPIAEDTGLKRVLRQNVYK